MLTGIMMAMFPVGLAIMLTETGNKFLWTTTIFLGLQASIIFLLIAALINVKYAFAASFTIIPVSFIIEWWGVNTGFPFGYYIYTDVLAPELFGVPVAITFAWFTLTASSLFIAKFFLPTGTIFQTAVVSSFLILGTDIILEPFASFVNNYWQWALFKIPVQNFAAWLVIGFIFSFLLLKIIKLRPEINSAVFTIPAIIFAVNILNFSVINILNGYYMLTIVGLFIHGFMITLLIFSKNKSTPDEN